MVSEIIEIVRLLEKAKIELENKFPICAKTSIERAIKLLTELKADKVFQYDESTKVFYIENK